MDNFKYKIKKWLKTSLVLILILPICLMFTACNNNLSAYELAVENGFKGTEAEWLNSLKSKSAYEIAVENGFKGTEAEWLESLKGKSAYELAVENGFKGTEAEWLVSLQGQNGENGEDGKNASSVDTYDAYTKAKQNGEVPNTCTYLEFLEMFFAGSPDYTYSVASKNLMSIVSIYSYASPSSISSSQSGSGVIHSIDSEGNAYIITNFHVAYQNSATMYPYYKLYLYGQSEFIPATFVGSARSYDIAVLKVEKSELLLKSNAQAVTFRDYDAKLAETCYAIGDTNKSGITLTKGVISVEREEVKMNIGGIYSFYNEIRHDAFISHGNSGGGLFDSNGYLIGITNGGVANTLMNYAIPVSYVKPLCDNIIKNCDENNKKALIIKTGIEDHLEAINTITIYDKETSSVITKQTVAISQIVVDSLFAIEGTLQSGDIIKTITYNGIVYDNIKTDTLKTLLLSSKAGDVLTISAERIVKNQEEQNPENQDTETITQITATITLPATHVDKLK